MRQDNIHDHSPSIVVIGLACYDHLVLVPALERAGEGARVSQVTTEAGGVAATAAAAAASLGCRVYLWSRLADDYFGAFILERLRRGKVNTDGVVVVPNARSAVSTVLVEEKTGERRFLYCPAEGLDSVEKEPDWQMLENASALLVDGRWMPLCIHAAQRAREHGIPVVSDIGHCTPETLRLLSFIDYPVFSEIALREFVPEHDADRFAASLLDAGARAVLVTRGERGVDIWEPGSRRQTVAAFSVPVVDTTGAGDCFHGAFTAQIAKGAAPLQAARYASAAAALVCRHLGGQTHLPTHEETERLIKKKEYRAGG